MATADVEKLGPGRWELKRKSPGASREKEMLDQEASAPHVRIA